MTLVSYIGHKLLSFGLVFFGVLLLLASLFSGSIFWAFIAIIIILAGSYFAKTKHR